MYRLTPTQREVLEALVKLYERHRRIIKSVEIAEMVKKDEGTVRNVISTLRSLGLLESKTGPSGGYIPTLKAIELVRAPPIPSYGILRVWKEEQELSVTAYAMEIIDILNPEGGKAILRVGGSLEELKEGDVIRVGPTPYTRLYAEGTVLQLDRSSGQLILQIKRMVSIPREPVGNIASRKLIVLKSDEPLRNVAELFFRKRIRGAPVLENKKIVGILTTTDIAKAFSDGRLDARVKDYMKRNVVTIREDEDVMDAIRLMDLHGIGRLIVVNAVGTPVGIVTRTDVLRRIAALSR
uniref:CBS domain-containing protein n=1 Tax=Fervidicoccus fontis TaxID=683846 RepID=A0A7J3ZJT0_9CREN